MNCQHCGHMLTANTIDATVCPSCQRPPRPQAGAARERHARGVLWSWFAWASLCWLGVGLVAAFATYEATGSAGWATAAGLGAMVVVLGLCDLG